MNIETKELRVVVFDDDHIKKVDAGDNVKVTLHGELGQVVVIEMPKTKYEEEIAPTSFWETDVDIDLAKYVQQITEQVLQELPVGADPSPIDEYNVALLRNGALYELWDKGIEPQQVAVYVRETVKAFKPSKEAQYVTALLLNPNLYMMITEE